MTHSYPEFNKAVSIGTIMDRRDFNPLVWEVGYYICSNDCSGESEEMLIKHCPFCGAEL